MKNISYISLVSLTILFAMSCTTARWTVKEKAARDKNDYKILEQHYFLNQSAKVTPANPVLKLNFLAKTKYQYNQKVLMHRTVQKYRLRPGFLALGLAGAATAFYAGNSSSIKGNSSVKSLSFNVVGVLLAAAGIFNMKPVGEPRPTGEERYLRTTNEVTEVDTIGVQRKMDKQASISVTYNNKVVFEEQDRQIVFGRLQIPLANKLTDLHIQGPEPGAIDIKVTFNDSVYQYQYPIDNILVPYALIKRPFSALRSTPDENKGDDVFADLLKGSQVRIKSLKNEKWYQVSYGAADNYIPRSDADLVWRAYGFAQKNKVISIPRVPFGNIDVENNIPVLQKYSPHSYAVIVVNGNYDIELPLRKDVHRDGKLMEAYFKKALGIPQQNILMLKDIKGPKELNAAFSHVKRSANDSTQLIMYLSGYGSVNKDSKESKLTLLATDSTQTIPLERQFKNIAAIPTKQTLVISDIDFSRQGGSTLTAKQGQQVIKSYAKLLNKGKGESSLLMAANLNQRTSLYFNSSGVDKKHHILPYFFAEALQQRKTSLSAINQYLQRNVSYTARKLHDRPQDPILLGDTAMDLTGF